MKVNQRIIIAGNWIVDDDVDVIVDYARLPCRVLVDTAMLYILSPIIFIDEPTYLP